MFVAITILLTQPGDRNPRTVGLFGSTFLVLAFDSYLFSLLTGGSLLKHCLLVWSIEMVASAMLAVGSVGLLAGIAWMLSGRQNFASSARTEDRLRARAAAVSLDRLAFTMLATVAVVSILLLGSTWLDYFSVWEAALRPGGMVSWVTWIVPTAFVIAVIAWVVVRHRRRPGVGTDYDMEEMSARKVFRVSTYLVAYAAASVLFAGILTAASNSDVVAANRHLVLWTLLPVALLAPTYLVGRIVASSPTRWTTSRSDSQPDADGEMEPKPIKSAPTTSTGLATPEAPGPSDKQ